VAQKTIIFIALCLAVVIIIEPWLLSFLEPVIIYFFNIFACLVFIVAIFSLARKNGVEKTEKEIISLTAHQLSSPLSSIKWSLEMLLNNNFGKLNDEQRDIIAKTNEKNNQLIYLVSDLLNVSKIIEKKYSLDLSRCSIEDIIFSVLNDYKEKIEKKKIKFNFIGPQKNLPKMLIDEQKIKLAVENLFDNAVKYTPPGGEVTVSLKMLGKYAEFRIQDSGIGIEKKQKAKVFSKFFRGNNAVEQEPMGNGLGLFFAKNIVNAHGGKIWFKSKENEGSTFCFTLPVKKL